MGASKFGGGKPIAEEPVSQPVPPVTPVPVRRVPRPMPAAPKGDDGRKRDEDTPTAGEILITTLATDSLLDDVFGKSDSGGTGFDGYGGGDLGGGGAGGDW